MRKLARYLKPYIGFILLIFGLLFVQAMTDLSLPDYMSDIVNNGIVNGDTGYILAKGSVMLLFALISAASSIAVGFFAARIAAGFSRNVRADLFTKVEGFSNAEFDKFSTASLITRTTNDIQQIQMFIVMMLRIVFYAPITGIGGIIKALGKSTSMSWIIAVAVIVLLSVILLTFSIVMPKFKLVQKLIDKLNLVTRESLTGMMVIRAFNTQKVEEEKFDKANLDLTKTNRFVNRTMSLLMPVMMLIMNGISLLVIWVGAHMVGEGAIEIGNMMAFMQYTMQIIMAFLMVSMVFVLMPRASVSALRISEVLSTKPSINDPEKADDFKGDRRGYVEFKNVSFRYPNAEEDALHDISFTAKPGQTTAFIGSTGSGKTTLINLIPRFYDVTEGEVLVNGTDVRQVSQHDLHDVIGYVPQKGTLFSGTIGSNLRYAKEDATDEELQKAASIAQATEFIDQKPDRYDSPISQGGSNVSGGQKQRLSIARALVKRPPIYIFDDSFSALDFKTDAALRKALQQETDNATVLLVGQRISSIMHAEQIIVLDEGRIVGIGTHQELMKNCEVYREIALSQLSKEELA
ncbi:ABC transporter ATP-binding protein [Candidatus Soleaferrea massiliensis]|uniref:ABC transporter ATP-binding protein n=1 Tax=Candidatus Soleaferrea massiliensis TaxID=1470354 RepID=UPI00058C111B|nr:ABC transporter ATP-binding protein [Candidatus Soleaferrea massiliensis]